MAKVNATAKASVNRKTYTAVHETFSSISSAEKFANEIRNKYWKVVIKPFKFGPRAHRDKKGVYHKQSYRYSVYAYNKN